MECVDEPVVVESCPSDDVVALGELDVEDDVVAEFVVEEFVEEAVDGGLLLRKKSPRIDQERTVETSPVKFVLVRWDYQVSRLSDSYL